MPKLCRIGGKTGVHEFWDENKHNLKFPPLIELSCDSPFTASGLKELQGGVPAVETQRRDRPTITQQELRSIYSKVLTNVMS